MSIQSFPVSDLIRSGIRKPKKLPVPEEVKKVYWSIGELSKEYRVRASKIRYLERYFKLSHKRNSHGDRKYTFEEKAYLKRILVLTDRFKLTYVKKIISARAETDALVFLTLVAEKNLPFGVTGMGVTKS